MISNIYTGVTATAKYKFNPKVGSIILVTARRAPPAISNDVVILVFCLNPNPNNTKNRNIEGRPGYIPLVYQLDIRIHFHFEMWECIDSIYGQKCYSSNCKSFRNTLFLLRLICAVIIE